MTQPYDAPRAQPRRNPIGFEKYNGNWGALAARAGIALVLGVFAFLRPGITLASIVLLFGAYAIADGILAFVAAIRGVERGDPWVWMVIEGILGIGVGVAVMVWPGIGALTLSMFVGARALVVGAFEIAAAIRLRKIIEGEWLLLLGGVLSVVFAIAVAMRPETGTLVLVWWLGAYLIAYGIIALGLTLRVRRWTKRPPVAA